MCGVTGYLGGRRDGADVARRASLALAHRGPDGDGVFAAMGVCLTHRRLAIIDVEGGRQPLTNEDGSVVVVLNGEIYNYVELTARLKDRHRFTTHSDTEVLVHLYEELGDELVHELRGMFAFAIWDARRQRLLAARDRFGEKPLVYTRQTDGIYFASEVGALRAAGLDLGGVNEEALAEYLATLYVRAPRSMFKNVERLPAGHLLVVESGRVTVRRYWRPPEPGTRPVGEVTPERLSTAVREAVQLQVRSDVPIATLLSGGIDSSVVTAVASREVRGLKAFTVGFGRPDDELPQARETARYLKVELEELIIREDEVMQAEAAFAACSEPLGDSSIVPTLAVCRAVRKHVKVVITGDGGDELFAGYGRYRTLLRGPRLPGAGIFLGRLGRVIPGRVGRALRFAGNRGIERYLALCEVFPEPERRRLLGRDSVPRVEIAAKTDVDAAIAYDLGSYVPDDLMLKTDTAAMSVALESRSPFLDHRLAELVVPEPIRAKQDARQGKLLLRAAFERQLPRGLFDRPKRGFGSPVETWLRGPLRALLWDTVGSAASPLRAWLDGAAIGRVLTSVDEGRGNGHQAWALLALDAWARRYGPRP